MKFQFIFDNFNDKALELHSQLYTANVSNDKSIQTSKSKTTGHLPSK